MNDYLVSIIIPAFKTEKYLEQCVDSALSQSYKNLEIILVDDGSPDRCPQIMDAYAASHENVSVIHKQNQGIGLARNTGLSAAHGKYVFFMDSDDSLDGSEAIRNLVREAEEKQADITTGNFRKFQEEEFQGINHHHLQENMEIDSPDFRFSGFYRYGHMAYDWGKLYRREFLIGNDIWSKPYPFTQDKAHNMLCYAYHPKYAFIEESVYLYRINEESVTFRYKPNMSSVWLSIAKDFHEELRQRNIEDHFGDITAFHVFFGSFFLVKQELMAKHGMRGAIRAVKEYGKDSFAKQAMKDLAKGKYVRDISCFTWKVLIRWSAILFSLHGYALFVFGISLVRTLRIDGKITEKRNKAKRGEKRQMAIGKKRVQPESLCLCELLKIALTEEKDVDHIASLLDQIDLEKVISMAREHRVLPMLYDVLEEYLEECQPKLLLKLQQAGEMVVKQSYRLLFLTKDLTELIQKHGIPVVVLKGCGVASYYPIPEYRKSGDVDLLFRNMEDVYAAGKLLEQRGYVVKEEQHANHHIVYQGPDGIDLELHAMLAEPFDNENINKKMEELLPRYFETIRETNSMGIKIPTTADPLQALELLLHMLQHFLRAGFGLKLLTDWVVFWNQVSEEETVKQFAALAEECGVSGFAKAVTLLCEKYLGLTKMHIYGDNLEAEFSRGYAEQFLMDIIQAEEFGKADKNRMVALRKRSLWGYVKEFHYQMRMNYAEESKKKWKWPYLWCKTFVIFLRNNRRLGRGSLHSILKSAGERAGVVEEMRLFKKKR
ncbi:MAG: glycosyltransferase [Lachnospiraceae bacterium]|jgi:glycosyltransferase involved in cell wall biosynthesis|nr:glycosyltransferase [Lachnospiraceae bacterium]